MKVFLLLNSLGRLLALVVLFLFFAFVNVTQAIVIWEKGITIEMSLFKTGLLAISGCIILVTDVAQPHVGGDIL